MGQCAVSLPTDLMGHQGLPKILRGSKKPLLGLPSTVGQAPVMAAEPPSKSLPGLCQGGTQSDGYERSPMGHIHPRTAARMCGGRTLAHPAAPERSQATRRRLR